MAVSKPDYELFGSLKLVYISNLKKLNMWARKAPLLVQAQFNDLYFWALRISYVDVNTDMEESTHYVSDRNKHFFLT